MQNENKKPYLAIPHEILCANSVTNTETGVVLKWNLQERLFYCWMLSEYEAFKKQGGTMHHNMDIIAGRLGVTTKSIERYVKTFDDFGLIVKNKIVYRAGVFSNSYVVHDVFGKGWVLSCKLEEKDTSMRNLLDGKPTKTQKPISPKPTVYLEDDEDCPF